MGFQNDVMRHQGYEGNTNGIGPTEIIWKHFRRDWDTSRVRSYERDFTIEDRTYTSATAQGGLITYQDTGVTIKPSTTIDAGLEIAGNDADNDEGSIGGQTLSPWVISDTAAENRLLAFEASIKKASIADNALAFFIGLMEPGKVGANALVDDTGAVVDADYIGFSNLTNDGDSLDAVYKKAGQTAQDVEADCATLVADTYVRLGFVYNPSAPAAKKVTFYVDGVDIGSYVTGTNIAAATFPDSENLSWIFATKVGAAAEVKAHLRWVRIAQYL